MIAIKTQDRWRRREVSVAEYEAHVICMSKPFSKYYPNVFVLNKVREFILDGNQDLALVLQSYHLEEEQRVIEERGDAAKGERGSTEQVWSQGPESPAENYH